MKVFVTRRIPEVGVEKMKQFVDVEVFPFDRAITREELYRMAADCEGVVTVAAVKVNNEFFNNLPNVRIVSNYAVGYDNIDVEAARQRGVVITNTPGVLTEATADTAIALILCVTRRAVEGDRMVRRKDFHGNHPLFFLGTSIQGKTLGIYGMGRIGKELARRAQAFNMNIIYHNRSKVDDLPDARFVDFEELLSSSDVLSINAPLTSETMGRFGLPEFRKMKPSAFLINTARGKLVKEHELAEALKMKLIAGAGLDVYEHEPEVHPELLTMENVVLFPHIGSATVETRDKMALVVADNIIAFSQGKEPPTRVC